MPGRRLLDQKVGEYTGDWVLAFSPEFRERNIQNWTFREYVSNPDTAKFVEECFHSQGLSFPQWKRIAEGKFDLSGSNDEDLKKLHMFQNVVGRAAIARQLELEREQQIVNRNSFSFEDYHPPRGYALQEVYAPGRQQIEGTPLHLTGRRARPNVAFTFGPEEGPSRIQAVPYVSDDEGGIGPIRRVPRTMRGPVPEFPEDLI
jgi:hypothetical protein